MPCTEIGTMPLIAGTRIGDPDHEAAAIMKEISDTVAKADGTQNQVFGTWIETPDQLQVMIDWETRDKHTDFEASAAFPEFLRCLTSIMAGPPQLTHVDFEPAGELQKAVAAPVTALATIYFGKEAPTDYLAGALDLVHQVQAEPADGFVGMAVGLTYEELEYEGVKGKAAVAVMGWQSVEAHMAFRQSERFQKLQPLLANGMEKAEMHHVSFLRNLGD